MSSEHEQFNPLEGEKPQALLDAERKAKRLAVPMVEQGIATIDKLTQEIETAQLASRFNKDVTLEEMQTRIMPDQILSELARERITQEGEAGYKKAQLLSNLATIREALLRLGAGLERTIVDFEASKFDDQE